VTWVTPRDGGGWDGYDPMATRIPAGTVIVLIIRLSTAATAKPQRLPRICTITPNNRDECLAIATVRAEFRDAG
jgi:hypothetical protein